MAEVYEDVDEAITDLPGSPTTDQVVLGTRDFSARELAAAATRRALAGGGGGGAAEDITVNSGTLAGTGTDVQAVLEELDNGIADHIADGSSAHAAAAISVNSATLVGTGTDAQAVFEELDNAIAALGGGGGGADLYDPLGYGMAVNSKPNSSVADYFWDTANRAYFWRLTNGKEGATGVRMEIIASAGDLSLALYSNTGVGSSGRPGTLLVATGAVALPGTSIRTIALGATVDVLPGDWIGMTCSSTAAKFIAMYTGIQTSEMFAGFGGYLESAHPLSGSSPVFSGNGFPGAVILQVV